jgi:hypothetical protein
LAKSTAAVVLVILIIGTVSGYFFYTRYLQGTVVLSITDPPQAPQGNSQQYDPTILHIYLTFSTIEIHQVGSFGNPNNNTWIRVVGSSKTIDMVSVVTVAKIVGNAKLTTGAYDQIRFPIFSAIVTFSTVGNVTYTVPSDSVKISITGGGFQSSPGTNVHLLLTISFSNNEILAMNGNLTPHASAKIVA